MTAIDPNIIEALKYLVPFVLGIASTLVGTLFTFRLTKKKDERGLAIDAYRRLMGLRTYSAQVVVTRFEAIIYSNYYERLNVIKGQDKDGWEFQEAERWMRKAEDGVESISKVAQSLSEDCAFLSIYFKDDSSIQKAIDKVLKFENYLIKMFDETTVKSLEQGKDQAIVDLQKRVEPSYTGSINKLLKLVKPKLFF